MNAPLTDSTFTLSIRRVTLGLSVTVALLAVLGFTTQFVYARAQERDLPSPIPFSVVRLLGLDREGNLPTWYQSCALLACAGLLALIARDRGRKRAPWGRHWTGLAIVFVLLSIDESSQIHESLGRSLSAHFGGGQAGVYAWLIPGAAFVLGLGLVYLRFLMNLPAWTRTRLLVAALLFLAGATGLELTEAWLDRLWRTPPFAVLTGIEETLEMVGVVVFLHALLSYLRAHCDPAGMKVAE